MMKTIGEKARAYDEAIEKGKQIQNTPYTAHWDIMKEVAEHLLPELKEGESEKIRKELIQYLKECNNLPNGQYCRADFFAWLEKQGEQKPAVIIPKFRIGDEIKTSNEESLTITKIDEKGYWSENLFICDFGDVAKWELVEQKPAWSEEDDLMLKSFVNLVEMYYGDCINKTEKNKMLDWLKSLRPQNAWKPSKEQMNTLEYYMHTLICNEHKEVLFGLYADLKKLKE